MTRRGVGDLLFVLLVGFALVPLVVSNVWGYLDTRAVLTDAALRNVRNVAALEAAQAGEFIRTRQAIVPSVIAGNQHLFELMRQVADADGVLDAEVPLLLGAHLAAKAGEPDIDELVVLDMQGTVVASSRSGQAPAGISPGSTCSGSVTTLDPSLGLEYGGPEPTMVVGAPIRDDAGRPLGVLCGFFAFKIHHELVDAGANRAGGATVYMLDDDGRVLCGSEAGAEDHHSDGHGDGHGDGGGEDHGFVLHLGGQPVTPADATWARRRAGSDGSPVIAAFAPLEEISGGVVVEVPVGVALASLQQLSRRALALALLFAVVLVFMVRAVSRRLARPLTELGEAARRMVASEPAIAVQPRGPRELVQLGESFNDMAHRVAESHALLEERIRQRTAELEQARSFVELLFDSIEQRVLVFDPGLRVLKANELARRDLARDPVGEGCLSLCGAEQVPCEDCPVAETFASGNGAIRERSERIGDETEIVRLETHPVLDAEGTVEAVIQLTRPVTAEKRMTAQLLHQEKMAAFGLVTAGIAHEIGNPLAALASHLRVSRTRTDPAELRSALEVVEVQVARMSGLLRELVDFARRKRDAPVLLSLNQVVQDVARLLGHDPRARSVTIELDLADDLPAVRVAEDPIVQVLLNLGINALDAAAERGGGGRVWFETEGQDGEVRVRVRDNGGGVPPETRPRIFEPFWTTKPRGRGTGLGLFLSQQVVDGLGGRLALESGEPGDCRFIVELPEEEIGGGSQR